MAELVAEDAQMEQEALALALQCRQETDEAKRTELRSKLQELTEEHFELRQKSRELQIARLEAELEKIRATVQKRNDAKDLIVRRRVSVLLGEEDELAFPPPPGYTRPAPGSPTYPTLDSSPNPVRPSAY